MWMRRSCGPQVALLHRSGWPRNPPMVVAEVCSTMKYPKRSQYKHAKQKKYHVRNWAEYNEGLRRRGDLTVWFDEEAIANWKADKTGKPGGQRVYSDMAIETSLVVRMVYKLAYRQTEGFLHSIASLLGLGIEIPDYSTLCRRSRLLRKKLRIPKAASNQPIHLMIEWFRSRYRHCGSGTRTSSPWRGRFSHALQVGTAGCFGCLPTRCDRCSPTRGRETYGSSKTPSSSPWPSPGARHCCRKTCLRMCWRHRRHAKRVR